MRNNLFISSNALTMVVFSWIAEQNCADDNNILLVVTNHPEDKFLKSMRNCADCLKSFSKIVMFDDYAPTNINTMEKTSEIEAFDFLKFEKEIDVNNFDNIFTTYFYRHSKLIADRYANADMHVCENGTVSYFKQSIPAYIMQRIKTFYSFNYYDLFVPEDVLRYPHIKNVVIDKDVIRQKFDLLSSGINIPEDRNSIIFCAQNMALNPKLVSAQYEFSEYAEVIKTFLRLGYRVYFKDHPKTPDFFYNMLQRNFRSPNLLLLTDSAPVEIFASIIKPKAVVGVFTSSLLTVPLLYNIPSYCIRIKDNLNRYRIYELAYAMIMSYVPMLDNFDSIVKAPMTDVPFHQNPLIIILESLFNGIVISEQDYNIIYSNIGKIPSEYFQYFDIPEELYILLASGNYERCRLYIEKIYRSSRG